MPGRAFLFLQGPISPFYSLVGDGLAEHGHAVHAILLNIGDRIFWRRPGGVSYRGRLRDWAPFVDAFMHEHRITDLVLIGEQRVYQRVAIEAARRRGIRVVVTDFGYLRPDWITLEMDGMSGCSRFPRQREAILALAKRAPETDIERRRYMDSFWGMALSDMLYHLAGYFLWWLYPHYQRHTLDNPVLVYLGTGLRLLFERRNKARAERLLADLISQDASLYVYPLQMANDFQIRAYSDFASQDEAIERVIASFAKHAPADSHLLVKIHPLDPGLHSWRRVVRQCALRAGVEARVHYVDGGNLDRMILASRGLVTINSTSGMRAVMLERPVFTMGEAVYDIPGITWQGRLDDFWRHGCAPEPVLRAALIRAMAATIQIRGVFYARPGMQAAARETVYRLQHGLVNEILEPLGRQGRGADAVTDASANEMGLAAKAATQES